MKKKWNKPAQFKRALAILFTAVLIFQAVPMQSAISMTANAEETTAGTQEDKKENSQNSGEENSKEKSNSGEDKKESDQQDTSKEGDSDSNKDGDSSSGKENTGDNTSGDSKDGENSASEESGKDNSSTEGTENENSSGDNSSDSTEGSSNTNTSEGEDKKDGENAGGSNSGQEGTAGGSGDSTGSDGTSGDTTGTGGTSGGTGEGGNTDTSGNGGSNDSSGKTGTGTDGQTPSGDNGNTNKDEGTTGDNQGEQTPAAEETKDITISYKGCRVDDDDYHTGTDIHSNKTSVEFKFEVGGPEDTVLQYQLVSDGDEKEDDGWKAADSNNETFKITSSESYEKPKSLYVRAYSKSLSKGKEYVDDGKAISLDFDLEAPKLTVEPAASDKKIESKEDVNYKVTVTDNKKYTVYKSTVNAGSGAPSADVSKEEVWKNAGTKDPADNENNIEVTFGTEGEYDVYFIAVDKAGNTSDVVKAQSHLIDKKEPAVTLSAPAEASNNFKVTINAEDQVSNNFASGLKEDFSYVLKQGEEKLKEGNGKLTINEGKGTETISFDDLEADGKYTLTVTVNDQVGNPGKGSVELDFDQNKPEVTISIDQSDTRKDDNGIFHYRTQDLKDNSSTITFEKSKGNGVLTKVSVLLIPDESISDATTYTYKPDIKEEEKKKITVPLADVIGEIDKIGDGTWTIYAYAEDSAGNSVGNEAGAGDGAKKLATVIVDDTAPEIELVKDEPDTEVAINKYENNGIVYFNKDAYLEAKFKEGSLQADNEQLVWEVSTGNLSVSEDKLSANCGIVPTGENVAEILPEEVVFTVTDLAGNQGTAVYKQSETGKQYYFDLQSPTITYNAVQDGLTIVEDADNYTYTITVNDGDIGCGVDQDSIEYAVIDSKETLDEHTDWTKANASAIDDAENYAFTVTVQKKGCVYIRAFDNLGNKSDPTYANTLVLEDKTPEIKTITVLTEAGDESTFTGENLLKEKKVETPAKGFSVSITATDMPEDNYSGLNRIFYELTPDSDNGGQSYKNEITVDEKIPTKLEDLQQSITTEAKDLKELLGIGTDVVLNGKYTLSVAVEDHCGNTCESQSISLEFDNTSPKISVEIEEPVYAEDYPTYHNNNNCGVTVKIEEANTLDAYTIQIGVLSLKFTNDNDNTNDTQIDHVDKTTEGGITTFVFPSELVSENEDGTVEITASATDHATNETKTINLPSKDYKNLNKDSDEKVSFILDKTAPFVTEINTMLDSKEEAVKEKDFYYYSDEEVCYFNKAVILEYSIEEGNYDGNLMSASYKKDDTNYTNDMISPDKTTANKLSISLLDEAKYSDIGVSGTDKAGNALKLSDKYNPKNRWLEADDSETIPQVKLSNNYVIDTKSPIIYLIYKIETDDQSSNKAFVYKGQNGTASGLEVYFNGEISVTSQVEDLHIDNDRLFFKNPKDSEGNTWTDNSITLEKAEAEDRYEYSVYGTDKAGNAAEVIEKFEDNSYLENAPGNQGNAIPESIKKEGCEKNYIPYYTIIIDKTSPQVSAIKTDVGSNCYAENNSYTFYYNAKDGIATTYTITEVNYDNDRICGSYRRDGSDPIEVGPLAKVGSYEIKLTEDGKYTDVTLSGTDRAGNHIVLDPKLKKQETPPSQDAAEEVDNGLDTYGLKDTSVKLSYPRILDRVSPVATIEHAIPDNTTGYLYPEKENESTATMYSNHAVKTTIQVEDTYGESGTPVLLDGEKLFVKKQFRKAGELFVASDAENWAKEPGSTDPLKTEITTTQEGHYTFSISGTDRAGNRVVVNESLITNDKTNAIVDTSKCDATPGTDIPTTENDPYKSFYALVYDCTAPVYRLTINNPSNLEETFDEKTSIAYYGKSVSAINAKYVVTDYNFDDTRIKAGITSESASGVNNMDSLSPSWTTPDTKGSAKTDKDTEVTTATFNLTVSVDGQHEGIHRFEIEGCDKAGNFLAQSSEQVTVDNSTKRADLAAKTVAQDASKGKFWTQRKAVDVSAPKGALKVRSSKGSSDNYYELQFEPGQNTPKKYDPARKETSAYVIVESDDCSPTKVYYNLRSEDSSKDAAYKKDNPLVSSGNNAYKNDNSRAVTVNGEQAFYLENIIIKDRAGNVRANDSDSKYTLAKSNHIYLDVTPPAASEIKDAEAPQVKIVADGSFTRHEADGERYIYKPDGDALNLKVTVTDPGGKERSSGINKIQLEIEVGGTDRLKETNNKKEMYIYTPPKDFKDRDGTLKYEIKDLPISLPKGGNFESNDITVRVTAWDNSYNKSTPSKDGGLLKLGIDTTAPTAIVTYQDTVQPQHDKYFKADRVVEIAIYDRNVDNGKINISTNTNVPGSFTAPHENKTTDGGDDGNKDKWTKTLHYDVDGDYTLQLSGTDALGNKLTDIKWNGPAPNEFTVDKTQPVIRINLPTEVNSQDGVKYYDSAATASIEIQEHNFFEETDPSLLNVTIEPTNHSGAEAPASPGRSAFSNSGTDMHVSTVDCTQDGDYEVTASYTDMAGNQAVVQGGEGKKSDQEAWSGKFVIDTVVPTLKMDPTTFNVNKATGDPLKDLADQIYTRKDFAPRVIINDINYDEANSNFEVKAYGANVRNEDLTEKAGDVSKGEYNIQFKNFEMVRDMDGVYKVTAVATDLAKHQATLDFLFSVNRFGSTYVYADEATESKVTRYYIKDTEEPLKILELSPVELKTHTAELFKDHNRNTLAEDTQYTFNPAKGSTSVGTNGEGHRVYEYTIAPEVYEEEGVYDFILSSTDAAGNENSTTLFRDGSVKDGEIEQVRFPINFQVDKTVPVNRLTGVESDKEQFNTDQLEIMVYPEDYQTDIGEVEVKIWDGSKNGANAQENKEKYLHYRTIREDEDVQKLAQEHVYPIEDAKAGIPVTLEDKGSWQLLEVITTDLAGNKSTDYRTEDLSVNIIESRRPFLVTTNPLIQFYNFKPALYGTTGGIVLLLFLLFFWKRRKEEKKGGEAA